jgi:hypothetical protein
MLVPERGHLLDEHNLKSESLLAKKKSESSNKRVQWKGGHTSRRHDSIFTNTNEEI